LPSAKVGGWRLPASVVAFIITAAIILILLAAPFAGAVSRSSAHPVLLTGNSPLSHAEQGDSAIATAFDMALNNHDTDAALALFSDSAIVSDPSNIACFSESANPCYSNPTLGIGAFDTPVQIRGWLQQLVKENIEVKEVGSFNVTGNHVAWTVEITQDEYRRLNIAPLVATVEATVQGGKIDSLTIELTQESATKLALAYSSSQRAPYSGLAAGVSLGIFALGFVFPAAAIYYISRVKRLFASVPMLDRPWILLGAGVGSLLVSLLLESLSDFAGISASTSDSLFTAILAICAFFVMSAMVLMKRAMIGEPDE
jgi:hypothetical protein